MSETLSRFAALVSAAAERRYLKKLVASKPADRAVLRINGQLIELGGKPVLQLETRTADGKALHENIGTADADRLAAALCGFAQVNLIGDGAEAEYRRSKSGSETILGETKFAAACAAYGKTIALPAHNRAKAYTFDGSEPFLAALGIADAHGRVYDKKQPKFRQINRFIEHVAEIYRYLPKTGKLNVLDLCCGKSYLSFAIYHYLTVTMGREVEMVGIDRKADVIAFCAETAADLGYSGLSFHTCDIDDYPYASPVHLTVSLHACDIATDIVLGKAIALGSGVILSTPCCQKELLQNLDTHAFDFITKYPMLKKKFCDAATDALRLCRLEAAGYDAAALELTDPDDTPKNILLRAVKRPHFDADAPEAKEAKARFDALCTSLVGEKKLYLKG